MSQVPKKGEGSDGANEDAKRHEATLNIIGDEFICPITKELPVDPVTAMDGRTYERSAIEAHIEQHVDDLKSPITNEPMGPEILDAIQVRNMIEHLVKSEALSGDKTRRWGERIKDEEHVALLKENAEKGDLKSMCELGKIFYSGLKGQDENDTKAFEMFRKGAYRNYPPAMGYAGEMLVQGLGVEKNVVEGAAFVGRAAERGDPNAAYELGIWYAMELHGMPYNRRQAIYWLQKAISGEGKFAWNMDDDLLSDARDILNKLTIGSDSVVAESSDA